MSAAGRRWQRCRVTGLVHPARPSAPVLLVLIAVPVFAALADTTQWPEWGMTRRRCPPD